MNKTFGLLNWFWWQHRIWICLVFSSVVIAQLFYWSSAGINNQSPATGMLLICSMLCALLAAITLFTFGTNLDLTSGQSSFPSWLYNLPVSPLKAVLVPVIGLIAVVAWGWVPFAFALATEELKSAPGVLNRMSRFEYLLPWMFTPWVAISAFGCWMQAVAWTPFRSAWNRGLLMAILFVAMVGLIVGGNFFGDWYPLTASMVSFATGVIAAVYAGLRGRRLSWLAESSATSGLFSKLQSEPESIDCASGKASDFQIGHPRKLNFSNPRRALAWRDWKQLSRVPLCLFAPIVFLLLLIHFLIDFSPSNLIIMLIPTCLMFINSPTLGKPSSFKQRSELSAYLAALPVSDNSLLYSRLRNAMLIGLTTWLIAAAVIVIWLFKSANLEYFQGSATNVSLALGCPAESVETTRWAIVSAAGLATLLLTVTVAFPGMLLGLFGRKNVERKFGMVAGTLFFLVPTAFAVFLSIKLGKLETEAMRQEYMAYLASWIPTAIIGFLLIKIALVAGATALQIQRNLPDWPTALKQLGIMAGLCAIVTATFILLLWQTSINPLRICAAVVLLFPFASITFARIAMDCNRHR